MQLMHNIEEKRINHRSGSLVKLRGVTRIKLLQSTHLCWRDTTLTREWQWHGVLATQEAPPPAAAVVVIVGLNSEDVSGHSTDQTMRCYIRLLCVLSGPFRRRPVTVLVIVIALWVWCELLSRARVTLSCAILSDLLGATIIARSPIPRSISRNRSEPYSVHGLLYGQCGWCVFYTDL